ncbi:MAG: ester cyclase [Actinomycetota bacterium]|nr:ester cyclase [Actinomycetota bacterium]
MGAEENRRLAQRFFDDVMNGMDATAAEEILAREFATHHPNFPVARGPEGVLGVLNMLRSAIPDLQYAVQDIIADDATVAVRWLARGTHRGNFMGIQPTGHPVSVSGIDIFQVRAGRVVEGWVNSDILGLMQQFGALPPLGSPGAAN